MTPEELDNFIEDSDDKIDFGMSLEEYTKSCSELKEQFDAAFELFEKFLDEVADGSPMVIVLAAGIFEAMAESIAYMQKMSVPIDTDIMKRANEGSVVEFFYSQLEMIQMLKERKELSSGDEV